MTKKFFITALAFAIPWAACVIIFSAIFLDGFASGFLVPALVSGVVAGVLFALILQVMAKRLFSGIIVPLDDGESVIKEGGANHIKGKEGVGGKLVLTNKRLIFKSHKYNIQNHEEIIRLEMIERPHAAKTFNLIENVLMVALSTNFSHKFIVDAPQDWVDAITSQRIT